MKVLSYYAVLIDQRTKRSIYCYADVDECDSKSKISNCDENADCMNTDGSYKCLCKTGYQGNGILCIGIPLSCFKY